MKTEDTASAIDLILDHIAGEGVECMFGVPGGSMAPLYDALARRDTIRPVLAKHEEGAAFMADGYARVRRRLGVCCGTTGPGATNALTGIACAYADSVPVLLLTAQVSSAASGKGAAQECSPLFADTVAAYAPVTKLSAALPHGTKAAELVRHAIRVALTGRPGPVHLSLPGDAAGLQVRRDVIAAAAYRPCSRAVDRQGLRTLATLLREAERPCLLVGSGVNLSDASRALALLVERHGIPVATTPKAKGALPEDHPLSLGVFGYSGSRWAEDYLTSGGVDVLVVVGSSLGEIQTNTWDPRLRPTRALVQIDVDPEVIGRNYQIELGMVGDARASLEELAAELGDQPLPSAPASRTRLAELRRDRPRCHQPDPSLDGAAAVHPLDLVSAVQRSMTADAMLFLDIGNCMSWFLHHYECRRPDAFFLACGWGSMGSSIGMAVGGALAAPGRQAVAVLGDAAFAMNGMEVHTAVECQLPITFVVLNDGGHGMIEHGGTLLLGRPLRPSRFTRRLDIKRIAEGLGAQGFAAGTPAEVGAALTAARAMKGPSVVDVAIDPRVVAPTLRSRAETLKSFFAGQAQRRP